MKSIISAIGQAAAAAAAGFGLPTGSKLEPASKAMTIEARYMGPASLTPDTSTPIGTIEGAVIKAPPDDPNREPPSIWTDPPSWMTEGVRWL